MKPKPRMCSCIQCRRSRKFRIEQRKFFNRTLRHKLKQNAKNWDYEMINLRHLIYYFTD